MRKYRCVFPLITLPAVTLFLAAGPLLAKSAGHETSSAPDPVVITVRLLDGSELSAAVDEQTNDEVLVLQFSSPGILLRRSVPWNQITAATLNQRQLSPAELKAELSRLNLTAGIDPLATTATSIVASPTAGGVVTVTRPPTVAGSRGSGHDPDQIQSLQVRAEAANWDRDAAIDGIRMHLRPLNHRGEVVPVSGQVTVQLFGQSVMQSRSTRPHRTPDAFPVLGDWTHRVRVRDFDSDGAVYQFRFRRTNPEFTRELGSFGLTHARLAVAGKGVFEASDDMTQVRPFSVFRDWHQQLTGNRFLPAEHVNSGNRHSSTNRRRVFVNQRGQVSDDRIR